MKFHKKKQVKNLFERYLAGTCTAEERQLVDRYLDSHQNPSKDWTDYNFKKVIEGELWQKIKIQALGETESKTIPIYQRPWSRYAAIFIGLAIALLAYFRLNGPNEMILEVKTDMVVLQTENGKNHLSGETSRKITDRLGRIIASVEGGVVRYNNNNYIKRLVFNEIDVPLGKTFKLCLSDGTLVHLNAGTKLKYPIHFIPGAKREVYLSGEAYFEVTQDKSNPFVVLADEMAVTVLGTHFNVSSYEGSKQHTVLVEGSVSVDNLSAEESNQKTIVIKPGQKAIMVPEGLNVNEVDVEQYIGWTHNLLMFQDELFPEIIEKIERKYNVEIVNNFTELNTARFNGKFGDESIIGLMDTFKESANFEYQIDNGKIIINQKKNHL